MLCGRLNTVSTSSWLTPCFNVTIVAVAVPIFRPGWGELTKGVISAIIWHTVTVYRIT
jgi:hypothetical protein